MGILCLSAAIAAWSGLRALRRFAPVLHTTPGAGWCVFMPSLGFLMVVGMPATVLAGAGLLALGVLYLRERNEMAGPRVLLALAGALFALAALHTDPAARLLIMPMPALLGLMFAGWWILVFVAPYGPVTVAPFSAGIVPAAAVMIAAPLQAPAAMPLAYDAAIIVSAFAGLWLAGRPGTLPVHPAVRMGFGLLVAYLQLDAVWRGAWIAAAVSLAIWLCSIGWAWVQDERWGQMHAH